MRACAFFRPCCSFKNRQLDRCGHPTRPGVAAPVPCMGHGRTRRPARLHGRRRPIQATDAVTLCAYVYVMEIQTRDVGALGKRAREGRKGPACMQVGGRRRTEKSAVAGEHERARSHWSAERASECGRQDGWRTAGTTCVRVHPRPRPRSRWTDSRAARLPFCLCGRGPTVTLQKMWDT